MKQATLCYCVRGDEVLLGLKKIRFGAGKWNGFGGKIDEGETPAEAAARELFEESGIATDPSDLEYVADLKFFFAETPVFQCHAFIARRWENEPEESDEMRPQWFKISELPLRDMWDSDKAWVARILNGERLQGTFVFDEGGKKVQTADVRRLS